MIDFVTVQDEAFPLVDDDDFVEAKAAMRAAGIDELPVFRAYTDDRDDFNGVDITLDCEVIRTSAVLCATSMWYEVTLYDLEGEFWVSNPRELSHPYPTEEIAIKAIAEGYQGYSLVKEGDLPLPLKNHHYTYLNLYRLEGTAGPSYAGITHYIL